MLKLWIGVLLCGMAATAYAVDGLPWNMSLSVRTVYGDQDLGISEEGWSLGTEETVGRFFALQGVRWDINEDWSFTAYGSVVTEKSTNNLRGWNNFVAPGVGGFFRGPRLWGDYGNSLIQINFDDRQYFGNPPSYRDPDRRWMLRFSTGGGGDWFAE